MTAEVYTSCGALCTHLAFLIEGSYSNYISDEGDAFATGLITTAWSP